MALVGRCPCSLEYSYPDRAGVGAGTVPWFLSAGCLVSAVLRELILRLAVISDWLRLEGTSGVQLVQLPSQASMQRAETLCGCGKAGDNQKSALTLYPQRRDEEGKRDCSCKPQGY